MYVSIDIGGTNTRVAGCLDLENPNFVKEPVRRRNSHHYEADLQFIIDAALEVAEDTVIDAVGIGTPGTLNEQKTQVASAKNISSWVGKPLVAPLAEKLSCPVFYDNDAVAAGVGEAYYRHDTIGNFHYLIWGTGIGGAEVHWNAQTQEVVATNLLWKTHFKDWEAACGGAELTRTFRNIPEAFTDEDWRIVDEKFKHHLRIYMELYKPNAVVFGGGLAIKHTDFLLDLRESMDVRLKVTEFGEDSGLMGGFGLIKQRLTR